MTGLLVPVIEPVGVNSQQPLHPVHQVAPGRFVHQVSEYGDEESLR